VFIAVGGTNLYHIIGMYIPLLFVCGLIKQNKQWSYFGSITVTTGLIITLGRAAYIDPVAGNYSLLRIQENVIGILLALVMSLISVPVHAVDLLKLNITGVFSELATSTEKVLEAYHATVNSVELVKDDDDKKMVDIESNNTTSEPITTSEDATSDSTFPSLSVDELSVVEKHKKVQLVAFVAKEGALVRTKLSQQPLLVEQSAMEFVLWSKPFPEDGYQKLIACQRRVLHMTINIDRALLRISKITSLKVVESSLAFSQKVSAEVTELLNEITTNLTRWAGQMRATVTHDPTSHSTTSSAPLPQCITRLESRAEHSRGLEKMHQTAMRLAENSLRFNNEMMRDWLDNLLSQHSTGGTLISNVHSDANIHHLFDISLAFNALFYASNHLATATMDLGNTLYTILLLEKKVNHKPF
jgi:hypothetical protein